MATTIYLSSTYEDLKDYRGAVFETLRKAGHSVIGMEDYVATDQRPVDQCLKDVEEADIYVGLFAFRYGYVPPPHHKNPDGLSITELEFRHAEALKKPCLIFIAKRDVGIPLDLVDAYTGEGDKGNHIERLRHYLLKEKLGSEFSQPHELAGFVVAAVTKYVDQKKHLDSAGPGAPAAPTAITWDIEKHDSPYPGLMYFTRKYAPVFFGRDLEVREILDRMQSPGGRFVIISGDSGVGKSSVVAAGVLPRIEESPLRGATRCLCERMVPSQGSHPFNALMGVLHPYATRAGLKPHEIEQDLLKSPNRLAHHVRDILSKGTECDALVLFLDQMEEVFTARTPVESKTFLKALYEAAQDGPLWVVATVRSDHLHHCHDHPEMLRILRGPGHYPLGPIEPFMLSDLIAKPARCAGLRIDDHLVRRIVHETLEQADEAARPDQGNLPLLAFVLDQLFKKRSDHELSAKVYTELGGVAGAIARHAEQVEAELHRLRGAEAHILLPKLFDSLVIVNAKGLPTRRRPLRAEFPSVMNDLIEGLVRARLLRTEGKGEGATVSISHEKLFEAWPSLKQYVDTNNKELMDRTLLESRARKWEQLGKPWFSGLASGREYRDFRRTGTTATALMKEYLAASRRARWIEAALVGGLALLIGGTGVWLWKEGLTLEDALLTAQSQFMSIHITPQLETIPGGTFEQGDTHDRGNETEQPVRKVSIKPFAMGKFEVTFEEYKRFAIATKRLPLPHDEDWGRGRRPVINVSWNDVTAYATWLSEATGKRYRLPTESEWEYAARGGNGKDDVWAGTAEESTLGEYAVLYSDSVRRTAPVGSKKPNSLGLYDLSGNVWEWVEDCWHENYRGAPPDGSAWLKADSAKCESRVFRGGSWFGLPENLRASFRGRNFAGYRYNFIGFRLVQDLP
jgi:formylglycine-generating enzyme required for sulfatase activity